MSFHDDYMKENAKFRNDAGLQCYITRVSSGNCCKWCANMAGHYKYPQETPADVFHRHDNCSCTTTYENGRKRQDVWSKKTWDAPEINPQDSQPTVFTQEQAKALEQRNLSQFKGLTNGENSGIIEAERQRSIDGMNAVEEKRTAAGNRKSPLYELTEQDIKFVSTEIETIGADLNDFVFNSKAVRGTCFLASDGKVHIKGNIFPDENSKHPRDIMSVRAVLAHEYYGHRPYREQYIREDNDNSPDSINRIMSRAWADEFRASYMAAKNTPNLSDEDRYFLIRDSLSRAKEAGVSIKYNDFIRRVLYG